MIPLLNANFSIPFFGPIPSGLGAGAIAVGSIAVDPSNGKNVYVGTGEPFAEGDGLYGTGILKSEDGGDTFKLLSFGPNLAFFRHEISKIIVDPKNPNTLYAAVVNTAPNSGDEAGQLNGIYKSVDAGRNWTLVTGPGSPTRIGAGIIV